MIVPTIGEVEVVIGMRLHSEEITWPFWTVISFVTTCCLLHFDWFSSIQNNVWLFSGPKNIWVPFSWKLVMQAPLSPVDCSWNRSFVTSTSFCGKQNSNFVNLLGIIALNLSLTLSNIASPCQYWLSLQKDLLEITCRQKDSKNKERISVTVLSINLLIGDY